MQKEKASSQIFRKRTLTRLIAVQTLYQFEFYKKENSLELLKNDLIDNYLLQENDEIKSYRDKIDLDFLNLLLSSIDQYLFYIDENILNTLKNYPKIEKNNSSLMNQILRFASLEFKASDTDFKIIINEYVGIASSFFNGSQTNLVNSILENLAKNIRKNEQ